MKNMQIPPLVTFLSGWILFFLSTFFNPFAVIIEAIQALAGLLIIIGFAGLIGKLFSKKHE